MTTRQPAGDERERALLIRTIRHGCRRLVLRTNEYVQDVARRTHHSDADIHAVGVLKAAAEAGEPVTAGELGRTLALSPAATSALLRRMEVAGHLRRDRWGEDGRRVAVSPTSSALALSEEHFAALVEAYGDVLDRFTDAEIRVAAEVIEALTGATDDARHGRSG